MVMRVGSNLKVRADGPSILKNINVKDAFHLDLSIAYKIFHLSVVATLNLDSLETINTIENP